MSSLLSRLFSSWRPKRDKRPALQAASLQESQVKSLLSLVGPARTEGPDAESALAQALYDAGLERLENSFPGEAATALAAAVSLGSTKDYLQYNLAMAYSRSGQAQAAHESFLTAMKEGHRSLQGDGYFVRNLYALAGISLEEIKQHALSWAAQHAVHSPAVSHKNKEAESSVLKVGLLSGRFCRHAVGFLTLGGLEHLDNTRVELILFDNGSLQDDYHDRFRAIAKSVHDISALPDDEAAALIQTHDIQVLVDMGGHSAGGRMGVLARKPAPVQVKWAGGQHGTTGLAQIDYFLTDPVETPKDHDPYFVECPVRLPNSYALYTPPPDVPDVNALPYTANGFITFGCFNNIAKISPDTIEAWSRILSDVPNSRLVLKHLALDEEVTRTRIAALFQSHGVSSQRLELRVPTNQVGHLSAYHDVDITLDPFPWSGCVTTCESLWMGVPVLALPGVAFCHRHSASFLTTLGLEDWIAEDRDDYVAKAVEIARSPDSLIGLRDTLRSRMRSSALCDAQAFAQNLELALFQMTRANRSKRMGTQDSA